MKILDITRELFSAPVFQGDMAPSGELLSDMDSGALYNLTRLSLTSHSGTHIDAPKHFIKDGRSIDETVLERFIGYCTVLEFGEGFSAFDFKKTLETCEKRLLIKGGGLLDDMMAEVLVDRGVLLIGVEGLTIGSDENHLRLHEMLLSKEIAILENIDLSGVEPGRYFLCAAPLKIGGCDGAPCRAFLIEKKSD